MNRLKAGLLAGLVLIGWTVVSAPAHAGIIIKEVVVETVSDPVLIATYTLELQAQTGLRTGSYLKVFDLGPLINFPVGDPDYYLMPPTSQPMDWSPGFQPPLATSVTWFYDGPNVDNTTLAPVTISGVFVSKTMVPTLTPPAFLIYETSWWDLTTTDPIYMVSRNQMVTTTPVVPEPATWLAAVCGLPLVVLAARRTGRRRVAA
jgi:hypothetical protein